MKIGIIGKGTVGKAVYEGLEYLGHNMCFCDQAN
jgi:Trk K+ transport system NAD-binding subunit